MCPIMHYAPIVVRFPEVKNSVLGEFIKIVFSVCGKIEIDWITQVAKYPKS